MSDTNLEVASILFPTELGIPEGLLVTRLPDGRYRIEETPFLCEDVYWGDIIELEDTGEGYLRFVRISEPGNYLRWQGGLSDEFIESREWGELADRIMESGGNWEFITLRGYFLHVPRGANFEPEAALRDARRRFRGPKRSKRAEDIAVNTPIRLSESIKLVPWQQAAVDAWIRGDAIAPYRGTLEVFTGGGKTLIALAAFSQVSADAPDTRLAVVVPTEALARQWVTSIVENTSLERADVGMLGAGKHDTFEGKRALVAVLNSAAQQLPALAATQPALMLVIDECHRAGAATFSNVLATRARFRLGLSATPARDEVDENGLPMAFDQQVVGRKLGGVVFSFGLKEAREIGWLPNYTVHHHGVRLTDSERQEYDRISRKVTDAGDRLTSAGFQTSQAWNLVTRPGDVADIAKAYIGALALRKDFLYRIAERGRVAASIVESALSRRDAARILLFHERVDEAAMLHRELMNRMPETLIELEHSDLPSAARRKALASFRSGAVNVLVSVKSLVEGIDVPDADIGVSVAASSSVRQRIQTLGRVLRRRFDGEVKNAEMHIIYAHDTVDELIYGKEDWSDLTGKESNRYWLWPLEPELPPEVQPGPPLEPHPSEEAEWERLGGEVPDPPVRWLGDMPDYEFSVDTRGTVTTSEGAWIENAQGVAGMVERVRGRPGGRFRVTPMLNLVIVYGEADGGMAPFLAGRLSEPFRLVETDSAEVQDDVDTSRLSPGDRYPGPLDKSQGTFKLRQTRGGVIERRLGRISSFALVDADDDPRSINAQRLISAWRSLQLAGMTFQVNRLGHAWYRGEGEPRFLAAVDGGFLWPQSEDLGGDSGTPATGEGE